MPPAPAEFDFEYWQQLAENDPAAFYAARRKAISEFIESAPPQHADSLRNLQDFIDASRAEAGTPAAALQSIMGMMSDRLEALSEQLVLLSRESGVLAERLTRAYTD